SPACGVGRAHRAAGRRSESALDWIFYFDDTAPTDIYTLSLHDALPILGPLKTGSGIGHLLGADLKVAWDGLAQSHPGLMAWDEGVEPVDESGPEPILDETPEALGEARRLAAPAVGQPWWISSYSALCLADAAAPET